MELKSPRHDPYSDVEVAKSALRKQGYTLNFTVQNEQQIKDDKGNIFESNNVVINSIDRIIDKDGKEESHMVHAIAAKDGSKGILVTGHAENQEGIVEQFLLNADRNNETNPNY